MTEESQQILTHYYQRQRRSDLGNTARITIRLLESLIRLSQAHARLMCQTQVTIRDAVMAVCLMESSMMTTALLGTKSTLHTTFPQNPDQDYVEIGSHNFRRNAHNFF
jgi:DNA helicase MCM9